MQALTRPLRHDPLGQNAGVLAPTMRRSAGKTV